MEVVSLNFSFFNNFNIVNLIRNIVYLFVRGGKLGRIIVCYVFLIGLLI